MDIVRITDEIKLVKIPFSDVTTSVYLITTDDGVVLFDAATTPDDVRDSVLPLVDEFTSRDRVKYVFVSHDHDDHSGGLEELLRALPQAFALTMCQSIADRFGERVKVVKDGDVIHGVLRVVGIPGHTLDSAGLFDTRSATLLSGDSLQLYGLFGSGEWGANISHPSLHKKALRRLEEMDISLVSLSHEYHPYGSLLVGREEIREALRACEAPLDLLKTLIDADPLMNDGEIKELYHKTDTLPTLGTHVVRAVRREFFEKE